MAQKWYQKASVQRAMVTGIFLVVVTILGFILEKGCNRGGTPTSVQPNTFRILGTTDAFIIEQIETKTGLRYTASDAAEYSIEFGFSGSLRPAYTEGNSLYNGGCVVITINQKMECPIDTLKLPSWPDQPGNPTDQLVAELQRAIRDLVATERDMVADKVVECLGYGQERK